MKKCNYLLCLACLFTLTGLSCRENSEVNIIDIMLVYPPKRAELMMPSPSEYMENLIKSANEVYRDNQVNIQLRLVHTYQMDIGSDSIPFATFKNSPEVNQLREEYRADLVSLLDYSVGSIEECGGTGVIPNDLERTGLVSSKIAFSKTNQYCSEDPPLAFIHELGHNMGLFHSRRQDTKPEISPRSLEYGYGYGVTNKFCTIMAYPSSFSAERLPVFSNPDINCVDDLPCGIAPDQPQSADAVSALNDVAPYIAGFYKSRDCLSVGKEFPQKPDMSENMIINPDFNWEYYDPDDWLSDIYIPNWESYGGGYFLPFSIDDLDRETYESHIFLRDSPQFGISQSIDPLLLETDTWYFFSALMRVAKDASPDYGILTLIITNSDGDEFFYSIQGPIDDFHYRQVGGIIKTDYTGEAVSAEVIFNGETGIDDLYVVRPELREYF